MGAMSMMMQTYGSLSAANKFFIGCELKRREEFFTPLHICSTASSLEATGSQH
jgi:hypothetical protein